MAFFLVGKKRDGVIVAKSIPAFLHKKYLSRNKDIYFLKSAIYFTNRKNFYIFYSAISFVKSTALLTLHEIYILPLS